MTDDSPEPTADVVARCLMHHEAEVHAAGWDKPPQLHAIVGPGVEPNGWTLEALMVDPVFWPPSRHPRDVVRKYADMMTMPIPGEAPPLVQANRDKILDGLAGGPLHVVVFTCEAWGFVTAEPGHDRPIADTPGGFEMRYAFGVAPDSTIYMVARRRGRRPQATWKNHVTGETGHIDGGAMGLDGGLLPVSGGVVRSMRRIVNAVNARAGVPLIRHVADSCKRCGEKLPTDGDLTVGKCPTCRKD